MFFFFLVFSREPELVLLDVQSVAAGQEGWLAFDVTTASNHWLLQPRSNLGIRLYVETEEGGCSARSHGAFTADVSVPLPTLCILPPPTPQPHLRPLAVRRLDRFGGSAGAPLQTAFHGDLLQGEPGPVSPATSC